MLSIQSLCGSPSPFCELFQIMAVSPNLASDNRGLTALARAAEVLADLERQSAMSVTEKAE